MKTINFHENTCVLIYRLCYDVWRALYECGLPTTDRYHQTLILEEDTDTFRTFKINVFLVLNLNNNFLYHLPNYLSSIGIIIYLINFKIITQAVNIWFNYKISTLYWNLIWHHYDNIIQLHIQEYYTNRVCSICLCFLLF